LFVWLLTTTISYESIMISENDQQQQLLKRID